MTLAILIYDKTYKGGQIFMQPWHTCRDYLAEGVVLSTVRPVALAWYGEYETAISFDHQRNWKILRGYSTLEEAKKGHEYFKNMTIEELKNIKGIG